MTKSLSPTPTSTVGFIDRSTKGLYDSTRLAEKAKNRR